MLRLAAAELRSKGYTTQIEPHITTRGGTRIPDIVCWREGTSFVLDVQVCGDSNAIFFRVAHCHKVAKYSKPEVLDYAMRMAGGDSPLTISSITVSWRGIVARPTLLTLKHLDISKDFATRSCAGHLWVRISLRQLHGNIRRRRRRLG